MLARLFSTQPFFIVAMGLTALSMYLPMFVATTQENWLVARTFFYHATFFLILAGILSIPFMGRNRRRSAMEFLIGVFSVLLVLPAMMALPVQALIGHLTFFQAYFEMLSCLTTTGASLLDDPEAIDGAVHFWRAQVGWLGGYLILVVALSIFAPLNIGGFEIYSNAKSTDKRLDFIVTADTGARVAKFAGQIAPVYFALTAVLAICLVLSGQAPLVGAVHAMAVLSTSGISATGGLTSAGGGFTAELVMFLFMLFAVSRYTLLQDKDGRSWKSFRRDKEINIALICVVVIPALLFLRHWTAAFEVQAEQDSVAALASLWGGVFTVLSFLTTTGFESQSWGASQTWSGLETPGMIFMGLAIMGGGVATTAGGIKLLRVYVLYKHGTRELEKLRYPSSIGGSGKKIRAMRKDGAYIAWVTLMLFVLSIGIVTLALSATGIVFEDSLALAIAGLSTTGPLLAISSDTGLSYSDISDASKFILCIAMILGRLEALAVIALLNTNLWQK
jgi:trk system potassium uptake protein TrkH